MPSATTAESNDSMAPSIAIVKAGPISMMIWENERSGMANDGSPGAMPPKALPMVATPGICNTACSAVAMTIATSGPGTRASPLMRGA